MRIDTAPTTPAGWSVTSYDRPQDALAVQQPAIAVHPGRPPPAGFGARSPSRERRSSSKPSTPQEALELSTVSARISPSPRHLTPSKARPGAEQTAERVRERKRSEEASRLRSGSPNAPSLEPSQISVLSSELSRKGVYRHDGGELESSGLPRGIKQMTEAEMSEYGPAGVKRQTLRPPPPPKPTIGQLRRAKSSGPARRQSPPRALARRDGQAAGQQPVVVARPRFEVPVEPSSAVLDGFMILEAACAELPEEVETVCLSGRSIHAVEEADLPHFSMLREADASDNLLPGMGALAGLPALRYLRLSANGLGRLELAAGTFESLQELDLSFNRLEAGEALEPLSELPALRKLDLTGNSMPSLPGVVSGFTALEELCLACNGLRGGALLALQRLPSLRALSVQDNVISKLPAWTEARPFPELLELNLTNNHVGSASALVPLEELPSIQRVRLAGNPLSAKASMAAKKAARAKESEFRAAGVTNLIAGSEQMLQSAMGKPPKGDQAVCAAPATEDSSGGPPRRKNRIRVELKEPALKPPSLSKTFADAGLPSIVDETAKPLPRPGDPYSGMLGKLREEDVNHGAVMEAFARLSDQVQGWGLHAEEIGQSLETVAEGFEEGPDGAAEEYTDNTFLTGVVVDGHGDTAGEAVGQEPPGRDQGSEAGDAQADESDTGTADVDPTVRVAVDLGMDPSLLSIYLGHLGGDCASAIKALRFALAHPLAGEDEGLRPKPNHRNNTISTRAKQKERYLKPISSSVQAKVQMMDVKMDRVQSIEQVLQSMKDRLAEAEANLLKDVGPEETQLALSVNSIQSGSVSYGSHAAAVAGELQSTQDDSSAPGPRAERASATLGYS